MRSVAAFCVESPVVGSPQPTAGGHGGLHGPSGAVDGRIKPMSGYELLLRDV